MSAVSSWLLASERGNAFAEVILSLERRERERERERSEEESVVVDVVYGTDDGRATPLANS